MVTHGSERAAPAEAYSEKQENKEAAKAKTEEKYEIPFVVNGRFVGAPMAGAVGAGLEDDAAVGMAATAAIAGRAAVERGQMASMAAAARMESQPMHPEMWPNPVVNAKAVLDSKGLDNGEVTSAFGANMERTKATVIGRTARKLAFKDKVRYQRAAIKLATARSIQADKIATFQAIRQDRIGVAKTKAKRMANYGLAMEKVNAAKEEAMAHAIKQKQAQQAALMGRMIGAKEGAEDAARVDAEMKHKWEMERAATAYAAEKRAALQAKAAQRAAIEKDTAMRAAELDIYAARNKKEAEALTASSAADASLWEDDINGPEGMKNVMELHEADRAAEGYARMAGKDAKVTGDLAAGAGRKAVADEVDLAESKLADLEDSWP
jgi:hypothetical protein